MKADLTHNETQRLGALQNCRILDSPPEPSFDRLTRLAAQLFQVPTALISLVDRDRQWFKSRVGSDVQETSRDVAFCAHALLSEEPLVVFDATQDTRFQDNPLVTADQGIRFYAGVPIMSPDGYPLGTLCVLDKTPRYSWDAGQMDLLIQLGEIVTDEVRLRVETQAVLDLSRTLAHRAHHDSLTGLPNRSLFESELARSLQTSDSDRQPAVFFIDLDQFKMVNDSFGHHVGDEFLVRVAGRLRDHIGSRGLLARLGGDEFIVLLQHPANLNEITGLAQDMIQSLKESILIGELELFASASIGISVAPDDGRDPVTLMRNADIAMYAAKGTGPNQFQFASRDRSEKLLRLRSIKSSLYHALAERRFHLYYQPQYTLAGELIGVEALIRLTDPELGAISPGEFIPMAESNGLIIEIGDWVLAEACAQAARWSAIGRPIRVAVNVSPLQLQDPGFVARIAEALRKTNLAAELLELEITETAFIANLEQCEQVLHKVLALGVKVAMDDFGTGYSSIRYLQRLPLQTVKIDRVFIDDLSSDNSSSLELIKGMLLIAHAVGLEVVAEGVETERQRALLENMGCDFAQGFLFSKPLPAEALLEVLIKNGKVPRCRGIDHRLGWQHIPLRLNDSNIAA